MKRIFFWLVLIVSIAVFVSSCAKSDDSKTSSTDNTTSSSEDSSTSCTKFIFNNNLHSSLPNEWVEQFKIIMVNLDKVIPVKATSYFCSLDIYAWTDSIDKPFKDRIGNTGGSSISGNEGGRFMVLEMSSSEFKNKDIHRYLSLIHI